MYIRLKIVFLSVLILFAIIIVRLFYWQVAASDALGEMADRQMLNSTRIPARRGSIFSSDGRELVINQKSYLLYAEPNKLLNTSEMARILSKELPLNEVSLSAQLKIANLSWLQIADRLDESQMQKIDRYKLSGIGFLEGTKRYYPEASMAAHLLGFVGKNSKGEDQGYFGIEGYYDEQLRGKNGQIRHEKDAKGNPILSENLDEIPAENGRDLYLSIDKTVQYIAEKKLAEGIDKYGAKGGSVVIMDPYSGEIVAMASFPSYSPVNFTDYSQELYKNPAIASSYEPGSTFKVLVMAAALNEGKVKTDDRFPENGPVEIGGYQIKTWNQKYHGEISLAQILEYSSNVGMVMIEKKLGDDNLLKYLEYLGIGRPTDIDLQDESTPELRQKNKWYEIDYATASFGQGIAVTPLQMVTAVSAIANGGKLMKPHVVRKIVTDNRTVIIKPEVKKLVFKKETSSVIAEMMTEAVENGETKFIKPPGYKIAGKTGTAQIPIKGHYDEQKTIASFIGFAPVNQPKFTMLVTVNEPTASPWGSETAAPIFFSIAKELYTYFGISPD